MAQNSFPATHRLRTKGEFARVFAADHVASNETLVVHGAANSLPHARLGLSVSGRVGNAVVRNLWKRRIREAFRLLQKELPPGIDLVVRPRKGAACEFQAICRSLPQLARRIARQLAR